MNSTILTAKAVPKLRRVRVYPRLTLDVRKRLTEYCARKGLTERDIIEEAIRQYLDGTADSAKVLAQLERLALAIDAERERREGAHREVHRAIEVLSEVFGRFVRLWLFVHAANPPYDGVVGAQEKPRAAIEPPQAASGRPRGPHARRWLRRPERPRCRRCRDGLERCGLERQAP